MTGEGAARRSEVDGPEQTYRAVVDIDHQSPGVARRSEGRLIGQRLNNQYVLTDGAVFLLDRRGDINDPTPGAVMDTEKPHRQAASGTESADAAGTAGNIAGPVGLRPPGVSAKAAAST